MDCHFVQTNLFAFRDKTLPESAMQQYLEHVRVCASCAAIVSGFESVILEMETSRQVEVSPFAETRAIGRIEGYLESKTAVNRPFLSRILQPVLVSFLLMAAVAIGLSLGTKLGKGPAGDLARERDIRAMQADLYLSEFIDEDKTFFDNK